MTNTHRLIRTALALLVASSLSSCFLFESDDEGGEMSPPVESPSLTYDPDEANVFQTIEIAPIIPTAANIASDAIYRVLPALPDGLVLDAANGAISGTPTVVQPRTDHVVRAVREVVDTGGSTVEILITNATIAVEVFAPTAPANLTYSLNPATYATGVSIPPNVPSLDGLATSFATSTPLPMGLTLSPTTGIVSGRPVDESPATDYVITASNPFGDTQATLRIEVGESGVSGILALSLDRTVSLVATHVLDALRHRTYRAVPDVPSAAVCTRDGRFVYVACGNGDLVRLAMSDGAARPDTGFVVGSYPGITRMLVDSTSTRLVILGAGVLRSIEILPDGALGTEESLAVSIQAFSMALNPANNLVHLLQSGSGLVSTFTLTPGLAAAGPNVSVSGYPAHIDVTIDGRFVYVADVTGNRLLGFEVVQAPQGSPPLIEIQALNVTGDISAIAATNNGLFVARRNGGGLERLQVAQNGLLSADVVLEPGVSFADVIANPDGRAVFSLDDVSHEIYTHEDFVGNFRRARIQCRPGTFRLAAVPGSRVFPRTEWVLATDPSTDTISALSIEYAGGTLAATPQGPVATGATPMDVVMNETRTSVYVANFASDTVSRFAFDAATGALSDRSDVATGDGPTELALDPSERFLYVMHRGEEAIRRFDVAGDGTLTSGPQLQTSIGSLESLDVHPHGRVLYVVGDAGVIAPFLIDPISGDLTPRATRTVAGVLGDIDFPREGRFAYVADAFGLIWQFSIDAEDGTLEDLVPNSVATGGDTRQLAVSSRTTSLAAGNLENGDVSAFRYDRDTGLLTEDLANGPFAAHESPIEVALDADSTFLYVVNADPAVPSLHVWCWICSGIPTERSSFDAGEGEVAIFPGSGLSD